MNLDALRDTDLVRLPKIKPAIKELWLEALRSDKYPKDEGQLRSEKGYCCLGVLCDIVKDEIGRGWTDYLEEYSFMGETGDLPETLRNYVVEGSAFEGDFDPLINRNDGAGGTTPFTFQQIANIIEERM